MANELQLMDAKHVIRDWLSSIGRINPDYYAEVSDWTRVGSHKDKCLPYTDWPTFRTLQMIGCYLYENCPTVKSAISKMNSYVVSSGHKYTVVSRKVPASISRERVSEKLVDEIKLIIEMTQDNCYPGGWHALQEESIVRLYREGEYFRRIFDTDDGIVIRFIEPQYIYPPVMDDIGRRDLGLITRDGDVVDVVGYWLRKPQRNQEDLFERLEAEDVQHSKQGVDANDPRGIPVLWTTYCHSNRIKEVDHAMCELALAQSAYAVIRQYDSSISLENMRSIATHFHTVKEEGGGRPQPGQEVEAKGFEFQFPAMEVKAADFVEIIQQQQRHIAGILDMPEFLLSSDASSGNRASLVSAEGPFDRRVQREQSQLAVHDVDLLWRAVQRFKRWSNAKLRSVRRVVRIEPKFPRPLSRDQHKESKMVQDLVSAGLKSPQQGIQELGGEYDTTQEQIEQHNAKYEDRAIHTSLKQGEDSDMATVPGQERPGAT
jgi:hypothetical protein